ncbi:MAG TPA: thiol-activated cytolysin family protein [Candidatus Krumholzibacteria bacterium]|nr:thiol-activated cytolysin family protein [Candidatus Krumholzibacteria bacterium]
MNRILIPTVVLLLGLVACSSDDPTTPVIPTGEIDAILDEAGKVVPLAEASYDTYTESVEEDGGFRYTYEMHDAVENLEGIAYLGLNDDVIWPGSMVRGDRAHQFVYEPITAPRGPITLSLSVESSSIGGELHQTVASPSLHAVRQGISDLVARVFTEDTSVPAQVDFSYQQVYSESQMNLFVNADVSYGGGSLETAFNWDQNSTTTKIMAKYTQIYFSVDMDTPTSARALFADDITAAQLRAATPPGSRPLYVAGVKYGMMALMCIETTFSREQMQLALDAAYSGAGLDVELDFGYTVGEVLSSSTIRTIVYGGSTSGIEELNGIDGFMSIIHASTEFGPDSPGVPLVYKFRHVADNTLAQISLTSQYTIVRPLRIQQYVRVSSLRYVCEWSDDDDPFYDADIDVDRISIWVNGFDRVNAADPGTRVNPVDQSVYAWSTGDYTEMHAGSIILTPGAADLVFDTDTCDWECARLVVSANVRDYDWASGDEWASGSIDLHGSQMWGAKSIMLYGADFTIRAEVMIEPTNK